MYRLADEFNVNYYYLSRHFKKVVGLTYTKYILKLKLNKAINFLINTNYKIIDIANKSGFSNSNDLNSHFKNTLNITPHKFRMKYRDIDKIILNDNLHNEKNTVIFFDLILNNNNNHNDMLNKNYLFNLSTVKEYKDINWSNTIDLNNIININSNRSILYDILNKPFFKKIIVNIKLKNNKAYLVDKNFNLININLYEFRTIINNLNKAKCDVILSFNYSYDKDIKNNNINPNDIKSIIDTISGIIGLENLKKYTFGLNIVDLKNSLQHSSSGTIASYLSNFLNIFNSKFSNKGYKWVLYLNNIETKEDSLLYKNLLNKLKAFKALPDKYLVSLDYKHSNKNFKSTINYYKELLNDLKESIDKNNEKDFIVGFNYDVSSISTDRDIIVYYSTLFCIKLFLELKVEGYQIGFLNYLLYYKEFNKKLKLYKYTHNPLGIKNLEYYLCSIIKSLGNKLIYIDSEVIITKNENDIFVLIYDDFIEYYNLIVNTNASYNNKYKNYNFIFKNLNGKYKIIEYSLDITNNRSSISDEHILYISDEDKLFLEKNSMPHMSVSFKDTIGDKLEYKCNRRMLEVKYIKLQKI